MSDLVNKDSKNIWHPFTPLLGAPDAIPIKSAKGAYLFTEDGRKILDAVSSWWVNIHGHSNEVIAEAIYKQALKLEHVIFAGFTHEPAVQLSENLLSILPGNQSRIFFSDDGSTSVEVGLKMAIQYWFNLGTKKTKIIAIEGAYHGDTFGAMSIGGRNPFNAPYSPYLFDVNFIPFPTQNNEDEILNQFEKLVIGGEVAAFIFEPLVQGAGGMRIYSSALLDKLLSLAKKNEVICIADEVMTGFGRTGKTFASDYLSNQPDIFCLSKGITGGSLPLGVTTCSDRIEEAFKTEDFNKTFFHGHSYTANPIICAAANASFELLQSTECQENIQRIANKHETFISTIKTSDKLSDARSLGTICAIEISSEENSYFSQTRKKTYPYFLERNILLRPLGNVIYILPPYIIQNDELDLIYSQISSFLEEI